MDLNLQLSTRERGVPPDAKQDQLQRGTSSGCAILAQFLIGAIPCHYSRVDGCSSRALDGRGLRGGVMDAAEVPFFEVLKHVRFKICRSAAPKKHSGHPGFRDARFFWIRFTGFYRQ
ncbi:MAG TPA: hypothetical protein VGT08_20310 [Terracidiphilus sp.]|nr:hypothetical protein [Terracidiphilus sp.]